MHGEGKTNAPSEFNFKDYKKGDFNNKWIFRNLRIVLLIYTLNIYILKIKNHGSPL
jgi:hypothetical protein